MLTKKWWTSKELFFNTAAILIAVGSAVLNYFGYGEFKPDPIVARVIALLLPIVNWVLRRYFTKTKLV